MKSPLCTYIADAVATRSYSLTPLSKVSPSSGRTGQSLWWKSERVLQSLECSTVYIGYKGIWALSEVVWPYIRFPMSLFPTYTVATGYKVKFCLRVNHCICGFKSHFTLCPVTSVSTVLYSGKRLREQLAHRHELVLADQPVAVRVEGVELGSQRLGVHAVLIFIIIISYGYHRKHISIIYAIWEMSY